MKEVSALKVLGIKKDSKTLLTSNQWTKIYAVTPETPEFEFESSPSGITESIPSEMVLKTSLVNPHEGRLHRTASNCSKHVVRYYGSHISSKKSYILMERCRESLTESIRRRLNQRNYWSTTKVATLMKQMLKSLSKLHENSIVHRDIKPDNIYLTENDSAKLGDFGNSAISPRSTTDVYGTISYLAPEMGRRHDFYQSDVWALGKTFFEMCSLELFVELDDFFCDEEQMMSFVEKKLRDTNRNIVRIIKDMLRICPTQRLDALTAYLRVKEFCNELKQKNKSDQTIKNKKKTFECQRDLETNFITPFDDIPLNVMNEDNLFTVYIP